MNNVRGDILCVHYDNVTVQINSRELSVGEMTVSTIKNVWYILLALTSAVMLYCGYIAAMELTHSNLQPQEKKVSPNHMLFLESHM